VKWRSLEESAATAETRKLADLYAERRERIAKYVPAAVRAAHARAVGELEESGIRDRALKPGSRAPEFELSDHRGNAVRSCGLLERSRLVICFFRGRWCPFCVGQLEAMNAIHPPLEESGAALVAISPQTARDFYRGPRLKHSVLGRQP